MDRSRAESWMIAQGLWSLGRNAKCYRRYSKTSLKDYYYNYWFFKRRGHSRKAQAVGMNVAQQASWKEYSCDYWC
ncbi:unnamed protein product [Sphagnum troendelagicum]